MLLLRVASPSSAAFGSVSTSSLDVRCSAESSEGSCCPTRGAMDVLPFVRFFFRLVRLRWETRTDEGWPTLAAEGRGAIGEEARAGSHQLLAIGEHLTAILRKHLHLPVHAFLAGGRSVGDRSGRRQLADQLGRKCHSCLSAGKPRPVHFFKSTQELLLYLECCLELLPSRFAECGGNEARG